MVTPVFKEKLTSAMRVPDFGEIYIVPSLSPMDPSAVDLKTKLTVNIALNIPLVSSPMDTVTEADMAIAMALLGGIGVVHRNMERERQVEVVKKVKEHPLVRLRTLYVDVEETCGRAMESLRKAGLRNLPVVESGKCVGHVHVELLKHCGANRQVRYAVRPGGVFRVNEVKDAVGALLRGEYDSIGVVSRDGSYLGTVVYTDVLEELTPSTDPEGRLLVGAAISPFDIERAKSLEKYVDVLVSDVAHFHNAEVLDSSRRLVSEVAVDFVAGNIGSGEAARDVLSYVERVSGLRVGVGGGSICTTPEVTGAYAPTLWAVAVVRDAIEELGAKVPVIADGGMKSPSDIVKALAAGASTVMLGYMLAATDEAPAPTISIGGRYYKVYRGMASKSAMEKRYALDRYAKVSKKVPEGIEGLLPYRGSVYGVVRDIVEAIKASLGYAGARNIEELWNKAKFIITHREQRTRWVKTSVE